jgi:type IV pilus assembly protein PilQ
MKRYIAVHKFLQALALVATIALPGGFVAVQTARAADAPANKLESISVNPLPGQRLELALQLSGPAPQPLTFTIDNPARISLDLPGTALALPSRRIDVRKSGLDTILAAEGAGRARLVLNLDRMVPYETRVDGNRILVTLGEAPRGAAPAAAAAAASPSSAPARTAAANSSRAIKSLDFRRGADGTGRVVVKLTDPRTPINVHQQGSQVIVEFAGADLPADQQRRFDVADFGTPVTTFDAVRAGSGTRLVINATGEFEQLAYQADDQYVIEIQPQRVAKTQVELDKPVYTGERINLNFQDIEARSVLNLLGDASGQNIVVTDTVTGSVTLRLQNVPWDQALDIVLRLKGLDKRHDGNVIIVAPAEELAAREKQSLASRKDIEELAPLRTEYLQVNYAKASDISALVQATAGRTGGGGKNSMLSARGSVSVDERTNTLLIQDTAESINNVRQLVATLDIPVRQVLIEARVVVVSESFSRDLGVRAGVTATRNNGNNGLYSTSGTAAGTDTMLSSALANLAGTSATPYPVSVSTGANAGNRYNVNLPVANPAGSLALMVLGSDYIVDLELSAAQSEGRGEVISSPRVITANQKEAVISQGQEIPYQQSASSGAATIQFKKAVLSLRVTPLITPDNKLILDLNVTKDSVGKVIVTSGGVNVPSIDTSEISTSVVVADGQTVVLGGILQTERRDSEKKVPYLGDVPVLGHLFKTTGKVNNKDELLIFVTPKILREGVNVY